MTKKIFHAILFASLAVLLVSFMVSVGCMYFYVVNIQEQQLQTQLALAAQAVEEAGSSYLDDLDTEELRLTLVDSSGTVLADTNADPGTMENHGNREEILEALASGRGESSRYSATLTEKTIYRAVLLDNGNVLRVSVSQETVFALIAGIGCLVFAIDNQEK